MIDGDGRASGNAGEAGSAPGGELLERRRGECVKYEDGGYSCWPENAATATVSPAGTTIDRDLEVFRIAAEHFRHDLAAFWAHSSFFLLIQGVLVTVFSTAVGPQRADEIGGLVSQRSQASFLAFVGLFLSLVWAWVAHRRALLIDRWREQVMHLDGVVDRHAVYLRIEPHVRQKWWYGPTAFTARLPIVAALGWALVIVWLGYGML